MSQYENNSNYGGATGVLDPALEDGGLADSSLLLSQSQLLQVTANDVDFEDPEIAALPRVLLMGPRRGGKTSIEVRKVFLRLKDYHFLLRLTIFTYLTSHLCMPA